VDKPVDIVENSVEKEKSKMTEETRTAIFAVLMGSGFEPGTRAYQALESFAADETLQIEKIVDQALREERWHAFNEGARTTADMMSFDPEKGWYGSPCGCKQRMPAFIPVRRPRERPPARANHHGAVEYGH